MNKNRRLKLEMLSPLLVFVVVISKLGGTDERQLLKAVWSFKLAEEFPKNVVQTPNPLKST